LVILSDAKKANMEKMVVLVVDFDQISYEFWAFMAAYGENERFWGNQGLFWGN